MKRVILFLVIFGWTVPSHAQGELVPWVQEAFANANGNGPLTNGFVCTYAAGSTTPLSTYSDYTLSTANQNPIRLNSAGRPSYMSSEVAIFLGAASYKVITYAAGTGNTCNGTTVGALVKSVDNVFNLAQLQTLTFATKNLDQTRQCSQFAGATAGAKIIACIADLPSTGGIADASGFQGSQSIAANVFSGVTKPVDLRLCGATYTVTVTQVIASTSRVRVHGCDTALTTLTFSGSATGLQVSGSTDVEIDHLNFTGGSNQVQIVSSSSRVYVHDNKFSGAATVATSLSSIDVEVSDDVTIENNYISGNGTGTPVQGAYDIVSNATNTTISNRLMVRGNRVFNSTTDISIAIFNCNDCSVTDNYVDQNNQMHASGSCTNCSGYGILFYATATTPDVMYRGIVSRNQVVNTAGSAIYVVSVNDAVISDNIVSDAAQQQTDGTLPVGGISVNGDAATSNLNNIITGNQINTSAKDCIVTNNPTGGTVSANTCKTITGAGVRLRTTVSKVNVTGNTLVTVQRGVYCDTVSTCADVNVGGNVVTNTTQEAFAFYTTVTDLNLYGNSTDTTAIRAIAVLDADDGSKVGVRGTVTGNVIRTVTSGVGIDWRGDDATFTGNTISSASSFGFSITGDRHQITGNRVTGTSRAVSITGQFNNVSGNNFIGNTSAGNLFTEPAWSGATAYVVGNVIVSGAVNYICILNNTNQVPPNAMYWTVYTSTSWGRANRFTTGPMQGTATLSGGTVTVATAEIIYSDYRDNIQVTRSAFDAGGNNGALVARTIMSETSFEIASDDAMDDSIVYWEIIH